MKEKNTTNPNILLKSLLGFDTIKSDTDFFSFVKKHQKKFESGWDELFLLVNTKDEIRRNKKGLPLLAYRKDCHKKGSKNKIHRWSNFFINNEKGELLLSKRADNKDTYPWFWEIGWGHCGLLSYDDTLKKELKEELWISVSKIFSIKKIMKSLVKLPIQQEYIQFYEINIKKWVKIKKDNREVKRSVFYSIEKIIDNIQNKTLKIIPDQTISILSYILATKDIQDTKKIKNILTKQQEICKKTGIEIHSMQIF
jgi:isopentenyldiphosphate isomerase